MVYYPNYNSLPLTYDVLHMLFDIYPESGILVAKTKAHHRPIGKIYSTGKIRIDNTYYKVSNLIWFSYFGGWPKYMLDHEDTNSDNNKISNLRDATHVENQQNKATANPHGYKGVTWRDRKRKPWISKIRVSGVRINLGSFETAEEAAEAYEKACLKYHGEFANLNIKPAAFGEIYKQKHGLK